MEFVAYDRIEGIHDHRILSQLAVIAWAIVEAQAKDKGKIKPDAFLVWKPQTLSVRPDRPLPTENELNQIMGQYQGN